MIEIISPTVWWMWTILIHIGVISRRPIIGAVPPHLSDWVLTVSMIKHLIRNYRYTSRMTAVNKFLKLIWRTIEALDDAVAAGGDRVVFLTPAELGGAGGGS